MGRELHRRIPVVAERRRLAFLRLERLGPHGRAFVGRAIDAVHPAVLRLGVDDVGVGRVHQRLEAVAAVHDVPVVVGDAGVGAHRARAAPGVVVLQARAHVVEGRPQVEGHVIGLCQHEVGEVLPGRRAVVRHAHAAITAQDDVLRIGGVDPHGMEVHVNPLGAIGAERPAGIVRHVQLHAEHVDARVGVRIDTNLAEVHRPRIDVAHLAPGRAGVVAAVDAALGRMLDPRIQDIGVGAVDVHADAAFGAGRDAVLELRPGLAGVHRFPYPAAWAAAVHAPLGAAPLIGGGVEHLVVRGIHDEFGGAGVVVHVQRASPGEPAVTGLVDAALAARAPQIAECRHMHHVDIRRIDDHPRDLLRRAQAHVLPRAAAVGALEDAVAPRRRLPVVVLAGAGPDQIGVGRRNRDVADRRRALVVEHRREAHAAVGGLVDAAGGGRHVEGGRIAFEHGEVVDPARRRAGPDLPEREAIERSAPERLLGHGRRDGGRRLRGEGAREDDEGEQRE